LTANNIFSGQSNLHAALVLSKIVQVITSYTSYWWQKKIIHGTSTNIYHQCGEKTKVKNFL